MIASLVAQASVCQQCGRPGFDPWVRKIPWRRKWQSTPVLLPGKSHGWRSQVGYSPLGRKESDTTEKLDFHIVLIMDMNLSKLQEIVEDRGAQQSNSQWECKVLDLT